MASMQHVQSQADDKLIVVVVPHTHWDRAWYLTFEQFRIRLVRLTDKLIDLLKSNDRFSCFVFDGQTVVIEDYLEIRPEQCGELKKLVSLGRLLIGPWYVLPDEFLVSPEALVRNLMLGHKIAQSMGGVMKVGYIPDPFGHIAQLPQILCGFGIDSAIFTRGVGDEGEELGSEFWWEGLDGKSRVLAVHQIGGYCNAVHLGYVRTQEGLKVDCEAALRRTDELAGRLRKYARTNVLLFNNGCDHVEPQPELPEIIDYINERWDDGRLIIGSFYDYLNMVRQFGERLKTYRGEFRSGRYQYLLSGVFSSRMPIKQANWRVQTLLERYTEPLCAIAWLVCNQPYPSWHIWYAWRTLMKNHPHDDICGCSIDQVHREDMYRYSLSEQVGEAMAQEALSNISSHVDAISSAPSMDAKAFIIFNTLPWRRTEVIGIKLPSDGYGKFVDANGKMLAAHRERIEDGVQWLVKVDEIPACGYTTIYFVPGRSKVQQMIGDISVSPNSIENEHYRISANANGTLDVFVKATGETYSGILLFEDAEDAGDEYDYSPIEATQVLTTDGEKARIRTRQLGAVAAEMTIRLNWSLPCELDRNRKARSKRACVVPIVTVVRLHSGSPRVDFTTTVDNRAKDHRLRVLFPTGIHSERAIVEGHFCVLERSLKLPSGEGWAQKPLPTNHQCSFIEVNDGRRGFAVINQGLPEYEVKQTENGCVICLTLLRCVGWLSRGDLLTRPGHAGPAIQTPEAQCIGTHTFKYAVMIHNGSWLEALVQRCSHEFNVSPLVGEFRPNRGAVLPPSLGFLSVEPPAAVVTALKKCELRDSLILRFYNSSDKAQDVIVRPFRKPTAAWLTNLNEERLNGGELDVNEDGSITVPCAPFEIKTVELSFA
ncbi:MAG: glycoside hydrolase family 38 C-terminal domain-containing protein [Armatimonadota bacterium]|nr:glycoside hydrolase family 38 C-terminal domain-containing protein [Armatimonadota bacterium]